MRFNPCWTAHYHIDLSRFINYMSIVENVPSDYQQYELNPVVEVMYGQNAKTANAAVLRQYQENCIKYGSSFSYGGPFIVPVQREDLYAHKHFYQIVGNNW